MAIGKQNESSNDRERDGAEDSIGGHLVEGTESVGTPVESGQSSGASRGRPRLAERLAEILVNDGDGDLLVQPCDQGYSVSQWLQAMDMQVMGACRADERLKPLLKMNVSTGAAEDCLLAYLSQHFEPAEVGKLARCLCIPLVSVRVGKIKKQGKLLCPTSIRGNLSLSLLPTSDMRISFIGDDGSTDTLATLCSTLDCSTVEIEGIPADQTGRSFKLTIAGGLSMYFWCSEKSKLLGDEMLRKMKDLLETKPSLAELTGVCESRLKCFAFHLRAHLVGSTSLTFDSAVDDSSVSDQKPIRARHGGLSARSGSFKESSLRNSLRSVAREKLRRRGDSIVQPPKEEEKPSSEHATFQLLHLDPPYMTSGLTIPSLASPYYCWCPPASALQYSLGTPQLPILSSEALSLPVISSLSPAPLNFSIASSLEEFPPLLPDPLLRLPLSLPTSQQIPTFTPLMCDPIVHIPFIDVCTSGGQGYLVSAGPGMSTALPPLIPEAESMAEKSARETLRMLINSSNQSNSSSLMSVLPSFLPVKEDKELTMLTGGSRGLYSGTVDIGMREIGGGKFVFGQMTEMTSATGGICLDDDDDETSGNGERVIQARDNRL
ncbi:unnamed protein product [Cuscuta epithymum]|uniref:Uncharacterized protein n=2 Tax=Cuscuta epithymum TaxID=186058 RepID=A0AAV0EF12_9ASTE|nr:unnamed protein product [Cuscuta epithymum]